MNTPYDFIRPALIIFLLAAPALSIKLVSLYSDDPYLQPLHITKEGLAAIAERNEQDGLASIRVDVSWGRDFDGPMTQEQLKRRLNATLDAQTDRFFFNFNTVAGDQIGVSFIVGANRYGPYPPNGMVNGIELALIALRMNTRAGG